MSDKQTTQTVDNWKVLRFYFQNHIGFTHFRYRFFELFHDLGGKKPKNSPKIVTKKSRVLKGTPDSEIYCTFYIQLMNVMTSYHPQIILSKRNGTERHFLEVNVTKRVFPPLDMSMNVTKNGTKILPQSLERRKNFSKNWSWIMKFGQHISSDTLLGKNKDFFSDHSILGR